MKNGILKYPNIKIKAFYHQLTEPHVLTRPLNMFLGQKDSPDSISVDMTWFLYLKDSVYNWESGTGKFLRYLQSNFLGEKH